MFKSLCLRKYVSQGFQFSTFVHYCWVRCLFLETKMLYNFDSQAANVSHCDSEPINVERIQTGCVRLSQPCPWSMSCDQSAAEHTSSSYQKKHPSPCRPAAAGSSVLQHRSTRMIHTFATTSTKHMSSWFQTLFL